MTLRHTRGPLASHGQDSVEFYISTNPGEAPKPLAKIASGGELSRIMLAINTVLSEDSGAAETQIFDEIDTGVSGSVADKMGQMICSMGKDMQVFAITHLPQVAAKGNAHYLVEKEYDVLGKATTSVKPIIGEARVMEIARMLSGSSITAAAIENAKSLLSSI